jgi:RNA polymerase sigma factor (sigma-70 family)
MLRLWLRGRFSSITDIDDIVQEAYMRVLHARNSVHIESPKAFLFATAQNVALGVIRQRKVRGTDVLAEMDTSGILDEEADILRSIDRSENLELLTEAVQSLPTRCRQILTLRKIYGLSQKEVAAQLGIAEHTVEAQGTIALRKIAAFFARSERRRPPRHE